MGLKVCNSSNVFHQGVKVVNAHPDDEMGSGDNMDLRIRQLVAERWLCEFSSIMREFACTETRVTGDKGMGELNLKSLSVESFKCFKSMNLNFGRLTVLNGCNGAGKSTAVQPVLLLSQMLNGFRRRDGDFGSRWPLNCELSLFGTGEEVLTDDMVE